MKKTTLIIIGIIAVVLLFSIWLYLLIYGTPKQVNDVFTNFGMFGKSNPTTQIETTPITPQEPSVSIDKKSLNQLTTRPIAGFRELVATSSSYNRVVYAEAGTGHIYEINQETGEETRISNTTVLNASVATFSPNLEYAAIRSGYGNQSSIKLIDIGTSGSGSIFELNATVTDFTFSIQGELLYTELTTTGTAGITLNPKTKAQRTIFTIPFQAVTMIWSIDGIAPHYAYPKASSKLFGYLYAIKNGNIVRQPATGLGLQAIANRDFLSVTTIPGEEPISYIYDLKTNTMTINPIITDSHKCAASPVTSEYFFCGYQITQYGYNFPDDWYKGTRSFADGIWRVNLAEKTATQLINPIDSIGRELDIINMHVASDGKILYFTNKHDNTLWMYEI